MLILNIEENNFFMLPSCCYDLEDGPKHTKDLNQAKLDLDKFGYCLIPDVLNDNEIRIAKKRLLEQAEAEEELGLFSRWRGRSRG